MITVAFLVYHVAKIWLAKIGLGTTNKKQRRRSQRPHKDFRSDDTDEFSDDSLASGSNSKPPSRPNSGKSGKRKRKPRNSEEHRKGDITSDEYAHSANSSFSDDSLIFSTDRRGMQEPSEATKLEIATINESINQMNTALNRLSNTSENYKLADGTMTMSPVNVWSSGDSGIQPNTDVSNSTCGVQTKSNDNVSITSPKRHSWTLSISKPEIWMSSSSESPDPLTGSQRSAETNMAEIRSSSPPKVERLHQSSIEQDTDGNVKYLVTINEDETKILYNVEKTEYRTFSVGDETNPPVSTVIPNTININLTETKTIQKKDNYEAREREKILYHRGNQDLDSADAIVSSHFYQEGRSLQTEQDVIGDIVSRESSVDKQLVDSDDRSFIKPSSRDTVHQESNLLPIDVEHVLNSTLTDCDDTNSPESFVSSSVDVLHEVDYLTEEAVPRTESERSVSSTGCSTVGLQEFVSKSTDVDQLYPRSLDSFSSPQNVVSEALYLQDEIILSEQQLNDVKQKGDDPKKSTLQINPGYVVLHGSSVDNEPNSALPTERSPAVRLSQIELSPEPTRMNLISPRSPEEELDDGYASINVNDGKLTSLSYHPDIGPFEIPLNSDKANSRKTSLDEPFSRLSRKSSLKNTDSSLSTTQSDVRTKTKQKGESDNNLCDEIVSTLLPSNTNLKESPTEDSFSPSDNEQFINYSLYQSADMVPQDALMSTTFNKQLAFDLSKMNTATSAEIYNHLQDQSLISSKSFTTGDAYQHIDVFSKKSVSPSAENNHQLQEQSSLSLKVTISSVDQNKEEDMENERLHDLLNEGRIENEISQDLLSSVSLESSTMGAHQHSNLYQKNLSTSAEREDFLQDQAHQHKEEEMGIKSYYHPKSSTKSCSMDDTFQHKDLSNSDVLDVHADRHYHLQDQIEISSDSLTMYEAFQHKEEKVKTESRITALDGADGSHIHGYGKRVKAVMISDRGDKEELKTETRRPSLVIDSRMDVLTERRPSLVFDSKFDVYKKDNTSITVLAKPASLRIFLPESSILKSSSDFVESVRQHDNDSMIINEDLDEGLSPQQSLRIGGAFLNSDVTDSVGNNNNSKTICNRTISSLENPQNSSSIGYSDIDSTQAALKVGQAFLGSTPVHSIANRQSSHSSSLHTRPDVDGTQKIIQFIHPMSKCSALTGGLNELHQRTLLGGTNTSFHLTESDQSEIEDSGFHTHTTTDSSLSPDSEEQKSPRRNNSIKSNSSSISTNSVTIGIEIESDLQTNTSDENSQMSDRLSKDNEELRFDVQHIEFGTTQSNFYDEIDSVIDETVVVQSKTLNSNNLRSVGIRTDNSILSNFNQISDSGSEQTLMSVDSRKIDTDSNQSKSSEFNSSGDIYLTPENNSTSNSSIYRTPDQSPRLQQISHIGPTYSDGLPVSSSKFNKTHQCEDSSETVDSLKWELARRIAKLQSRCKSLSDSAISSDFTDLERSGSFRQIANRISRRSSGCGSGYVSRKELDRSLQEISVYLDNAPPQNLIDHTMHRSMEYTNIPNQVANAMMECRSLMASPPADNLANILDSKRPARLYGRKWRSLGDLSELSGTEILRMLKADFDESLSRQSSSDNYYLPSNKDSNLSNDKSQRYISWGDIQCRSLDESNTEQDLVVSAASRTNQFNILLDECKLSRAKSSIDSPNSPLSADQLDFYLGNIHSSEEDHRKRNSVDQGVNCHVDLLESKRRIRHKSPSMSDLEHGEPVVKDFEKAHSTGCVDILDSPVPSTASSNDSITFVFVGNSEEKSDVTHSNPHLNKSPSSSSPQTSSRRGQSEGHLAIISHQFENNHLTRRQLSSMNDDRSERSASCDNLSTQGNKELRRSYSTSLLDVVQIEEPEIEPFPPSCSTDDIIDGEDERGVEEEFLPLMFSKQNVSPRLRKTVTGQFGNSCLSKTQLENVTSKPGGETKNRIHKQELQSVFQMEINTGLDGNNQGRVILVNRLTQTDDHNQLYNQHLDWQEYQHDHLDITSADLSDESGFITDANVYSPPTSFRDISSNLHSTSTIQNFSGCTNSDLLTVNQTVIKQTIESGESTTKVSSFTQTTDSEIEKDMLNTSNTETQTTPAISPIVSPVTTRRNTLIQTDQDYQTQSFTDGPTNTTILAEIADLRKEHTKMMALLERSKQKPTRPSQLDLFVKQKSITSDSSGSVSPVTVIEKLASKQESHCSRRREEDTFDNLFSTTTTTTTTINNRDVNDDIEDLRLNIDLESLDYSYTNQNSTSSQPNGSSSSRSKRDHSDSLVYVPIGDDNKRYFVTTAVSPDQPTSQESNNKSECLQDQLDKLQQERIEIIDLLNLNYLPASLTVELLEAKLNHCIGQTDALLQSVDETWDDDFLSRPQPPAQNITEISKEYINKYRTELKKSKRYYDVFKEEMERKVSKGRGRRRSRTTDLIQLKRNSQIEAFKLERQLEQERYEKTKLSNSRQTSPASPATSSSSFEPGYLTPRQRIDHLVGLRRNIVESSEEELSELRRRSVSPRYSDRSYSPDFYSLYSPSPSPRSMSLGNNPYGNIVDPFPSLYSPDVSFSGSTRVSPTPGFQTGSSSRLAPTIRTPTSSNTQSTDHLAYISLPYQDYMANQLDPSKLLQESAAVRSRNLQEISRAHLFLHQSRHLADVPLRTSSPVVRHPAEVREYSPQSPNHGITKMDIDKDIEQLRTIQKTSLYGNPSSVRCASPMGSDVSSASSYAAYAKDILARSERSVHSPRSKLNSTYSGMTRTFPPRPSTPSSIYSADLESLTDSTTSSSLVTTRPVNARDIKARIARRKITERRNKKPSDKR
ncbi:hypothetical protein LOTGIDRAFT_230410 [Lottia gigantea]|uniref:Uncharacterized protein n=1 Tax=Lottia gigantea TaxID=225164 RepID=V4AYY8_LOTGI|nr:hypothetical protein LOTGIDRAFT_230410 [Lottia gigantea]ESP02923.1 hypothetical protein LOTGIDRAFT_230410 [Lottia gigantea]